MAAVLGLVVLYNLIDDKVRSVDNDVLSGNVIGTFEQLEIVLAENPAKPVELDYGQLFGLATRKVFPHPRSEMLHIGPEEQALIHAALESVEGLENVLAMKAGHAVDQATINRIAKFKTLKRLSIFADLGYESLDLQPLSNLNELEVLQFGAVNRVDSLEPLAELPNLHTLGIGYPMLLHKHGLDELATLPHLRVLSLPDLRSYSGLQETVGRLRQSKTLRQINYGVSWDDTDALADVQSQVAGIEVEPSKYRPARHIVLFFALLAVAVVGFPTMQLAGQLSLPSSYLAPLYRAPHYLVACLLFATLITLAIVGLVGVGANLLTASSLMLCVGSLHVWSGTRILSKSNVSTKTWFVNLLVALPVGLFPFLVLASGFFRPMWVENYLMSGQVVIPLLCFVIGAWLGWLAYRNLESRLRTRFELGMPAILSFHDLQALSAAQAQAQADASSSPLSGNHQLTMGMKLPIVAKAALAVTLSSIPLRALGYEDLGRTAAMTCLGAFFLCVYLTGMKWWKEMPYFAATTTRPPDRMGHVNRLMSGITADLVVLAPLLLACVIATSLVGPWQLEGIGLRFLHGLVAVASITLAVYAAILWMVAIRSVIGIAILAFFCYMPCFMMVMQVAVIDRMTSPLLSAITVVLSGIAIALISVTAIFFARRYFARIEWARFH
ncbi:hypothetical protein SH528x_000152 [Novipirellula sp. SH528]|uniref:hypothetical protein n=1 Tax=Novipirellula sp. SH528 TaxID=3454466 RepID=UPI003FA0EB03